MGNKICNPPRKVYKIVDLNEKLEKRYEVEAFCMMEFTARNVPRIRIKCPICGRRVLSSIKVDHDGLEIYHFLPPHKVKKWWKKPKKLKRVKEYSRQI